MYSTAGAGGDKDLDKLKKKLVSAVTDEDGDKIKEALVDLLVYGGAEPVKLIVAILEKIPTSKSVVYWQLTKGVCTVTDEQALAELAEAIVRHRKDALGRDLLFALQTNRCRAVAIVHQAVLEKCGYDMQKMAIESLVNMEEEVSVEALIAALRKVKDRAVQAEIVDALRMLTRADCGSSAEDWEKWWKVSKEQGFSLGENEKDKEKKGGYTGTVVDELERFRRDKMFGDENIKLKALVITDT
jgi:hypothetical protein